MTYEDILAENRRLKAQEAVNLDMARTQAKMKALKRENFMMKHSGKIETIKSIGRGLGIMGKGIVNLGKKSGMRFNPKPSRVF